MWLVRLRFSCGSTFILTFFLPFFIISKVMKSNYSKLLTKFNYSQGNRSLLLLIEHLKTLSITLRFRVTIFPVDKLFPEATITSLDA